VTAVVIRGDARCLPLPDACVDLIVTSPPYHNLRAYTDGGERYEGQIGSEGSAAEYLAALWECTREWMRVLKPSGSIFVNLGDSYSSGHSGDDYPGCRYGPSHAGAPAKWTQANAMWLAGVLDCEGSVSARVFTNDSGGESVVAWMRVTMMDRQVCDRISEITGVGRQFQDKRGAYTWHAASQQVRYVLERIWPYLLIKQRQALAAIELCRHVADRNARGAWSPLTADDLAYRRRIVEAIRTWNKRDDYPWEPPRVRPVPLPHSEGGPAAKSLRDLPHRYAIGCVDDLGLIKRAEVCWSKVNGLPESVQDRVRRSHEFLFHFTRLPRYYAAVDEIREPQQLSPGVKPPGNRNPSSRDVRPTEVRPHFAMSGRPEYNPLGKLPGSVWNIPSQPLIVPAHLGVDHFASFPMELPRRCVLGWSPPGVCTACGEGRRPVVDKGLSVNHVQRNAYLPGSINGHPRWDVPVGADRVVGATSATITGYACACPQPDAPVRPAVVLDPFGGTGTTALVAAAYGRTGISVDMSGDYSRLARWRTTDPGERAKAMMVAKPPPVPDGQVSLFDDWEAV
jgi:hypothetical protein